MFNNQVKSKINACSCIVAFFAIFIFSNCTTARKYDFSLKNTLSIFLLNNEKDHYFCIPIQYVGDYQIESFEFDSGNIQIGDYEILLKRDEINISVYLNEAANDNWSSDGMFNLIYLEKNGIISVSEMREPLAIKNEPDMMNHYYIFIERFLNKNEVKKIINEYEKGNVYSQYNIWYDLIIDNEEQNGSGLIDDFELHDEPLLDTSWFPPNLDFFKSKYLQK